MNFVGDWKSWLGVALVVSVSVGCGSSNQATYPVKGRITFDGKPMVGGGSIAFIRQGTQATMDSGGEIKADGTYELMTSSPGDGAMAGDFRVVITQTVYKEPERVADGEGATSAPTAAVPETERIPAIYSDYANSPLTAKVEDKSPNELDFDLKRQ